MPIEHESTSLDGDDVSNIGQVFIDLTEYNMLEDITQIVEMVSRRLKA